MEKSIKIIGKHNIDSLQKQNKKPERSITQNWTDKEIVLDDNNQIPILNKLYLNEDFEGSSDVKKVNENKPIDDRVQHVGFGKKLIKQAENLAIQNGYNRIAIISAVGTRDYYRKLGYHLENTYMVKEFKNRINYLGLSILIVLITILLIVTLSFLS